MNGTSGEMMKALTCLLKQMMEKQFIYIKEML